MFSWSAPHNVNGRALSPSNGPAQTSLTAEIGHVTKKLIWPTITLAIILLPGWRWLVKYQTQAKDISQRILFYGIGEGLGLSIAWLVVRLIEVFVWRLLELETPSPTVNANKVSGRGVEYMIRFWMKPAEIKPEVVRHVVICRFAFENVRNSGWRVNNRGSSLPGRKSGFEQSIATRVGTARCAVRAAFSGAACGSPKGQCSARWTRAATPQHGVPTE